MLRPLIRPIVRPLVRRVTDPGYGSRFDYYVDSVNGDDLNDGMTADSAFATLAAVSSVLTAGMSIGLARGSHWREQLTLPGNNVRIGAYGTGDKPLIDASDPIDSEAWSLAATTTNVYQASVTLADAGASAWLNVWEDDSFLAKASSLANCDATAGSYYASGSTGAITLYVHPNGSTVPSSDGKAYEFSARNHGILGESRSGCIVKGVETRRNLNVNGSLWLGKHSSVIDCAVNDGSKHNLFVRGGALCQGVTMHGAYYGGASLIVAIVYEDTPTGDAITFVECAITLDSHVLTSSGYGSHNSTTGLFGTVTALRSTGSGLGNVFNFGDCAEIVIDGCTVSNSSGAVVPAADALIKNCVFDTLTSTIVGGAAGITVTLLNSQFSNTTFPTSTFRSLALANVSLDIQGCTVTNSVGWMIQMSGTGINIYSRNNNFVAVTNGYYDIGTDGYVLDSDLNTFGNPNGDCRLVGVTHANVAAYVAATGQDQNSTY